MRREWDVFAAHPEKELAVLNTPHRYSPLLLTTVTMVSRVRLQYFKIIIATSLVWFLVDVLILMYFTDCTMMSQQPCTKSGVAGSADNQTPRAGGLLGRILPKGC
ncbi:hypothetical protein LSAT2_022087 [Lamellibrachia satsuma]|nr:hypothetical protein LSAT2_022087 [Lamellibrachia satsuma]